MPRTMPQKKEKDKNQTTITLDFDGKLRDFKNYVLRTFQGSRRSSIFHALNKHHKIVIWFLKYVEPDFLASLIIDDALMNVMKENDCVFESLVRKDPTFTFKDLWLFVQRDPEKLKKFFQHHTIIIWLLNYVERDFLASLMVDDALMKVMEENRYVFESLVHEDPSFTFKDLWLFVQRDPEKLRKFFKRHTIIIWLLNFKYVERDFLASLIVDDALMKVMEENRYVFESLVRKDSTFTFKDLWLLVRRDPKTLEKFFNKKLGKFIQIQCDTDLSYHELCSILSPHLDAIDRFFDCAADQFLTCAQKYKKIKDSITELGFDESTLLSILYLSGKRIKTNIDALYELLERFQSQPLKLAYIYFFLSKERYTYAHSKGYFLTQTLGWIKRNQPNLSCLTDEQFCYILRVLNLTNFKNIADLSFLNSTLTDLFQSRLMDLLQTRLIFYCYELNQLMFYCYELNQWIPTPENQLMPPQWTPTTTNQMHGSSRMFFGNSTHHNAQPPQNQQVSFRRPE